MQYSTKGYTQNDLYIKQQLVNYIYSTVELSLYNYKIIEYDDEMNLLSGNKYYVSANYSGSNCLLVFIKVREKYLSYLVDRKTLNYNKNLINYDNIKIIQINIRLDESIYKGTIFNGIFVQSQKSRTFIITDAYQLRGQNMCNDKIQYKIKNIVAYLKANMKEDNNINNLKLSVNKLYNIEETETLINEIIPQQKQLIIKGIAFYPEISGTRLIFMFNNDIKTENIDSRDILMKEKSNNSINIIRNMDERGNRNTSMRYVQKGKEPVIATFELRKTDDIDVYKLYLVETFMEGNRKILKCKKMGIALIPTKECSIMCRNIFSKNNKKVFMKCKFINEKNKWQPISEDIYSNLPSNIFDVEKQMDIIDEIASDNE